MEQLELFEANVKEHDIRKALDARVKSYGGETRAAAWLGRKHCPDVLCLFPDGSLFTQRYGSFNFAESHPWIETKRPKKDATEGQKREHERMRAAGCTVLVITTLEELDAWLPPL
jgi:hypothetical protein